MHKITADMKVCDILEIDQKLEQTLISYGFSCAGCPGANIETLKEAAAGHDVDLNILLADLNSAIK